MRLNSDLVPPSPITVCPKHVCPGELVILTDPGEIDAQFVKAWLPFFSVVTRMHLRLMSCVILDERLPRLDELDMPVLTADERSDGLSLQNLQPGAVLMAGAGLQLGAI